MKLIVLASMLLLPFSASATCEDAAQKAILHLNGDGGVTYRIESQPVWFTRGTAGTGSYKQLVGFVAKYTISDEGKIVERGTEFISAECEIYSAPSSESEMRDLNADGVLDLSDMKRTKLNL